MAKTSRDILKQLDVFLDRYTPDIVISMIGINDKALLESEKSPSALRRFWDDLRLVKFFKLLKQNIAAKGEGASDNQRGRNSNPTFDKNNIVRKSDLDTIDPQYQNLEKALNVLKKNEIALLKFRKQIKTKKDAPSVLDLAQKIKILENRQVWIHIYLAQYFRSRSDFQNAFQALKFVEREDPQNFAFYLEMGRCFKDLKKYKEAIFFLTKAREKNPDSILAALELGRVYDELGWDDKVRELCNLLDEKKISSLTVYYEAGVWLKEHHYFDKAEKVLLEAISKNPEDPHLYDELADLYAQTHVRDKEDYYRKEARDIKKDQDTYLPETIDNYKKIAEKVLSRGIPLICMQYPLREIHPLQEVFPSPLAQKIVFIENKDNFEKVLTKNQYAKVFSDNFAADFGHCTRFGNNLIAQLAAVTIFQLLEKGH